MKRREFKLVIPVDGSENSLRAVHHAARLSESGAELVCLLLNVQMPMELRVHAYNSQNAIDRMEAMEAEKIFKPAREILSIAGIRHETTYVIDQIAPAIVSYADKNQCDGIVMGMRGMGLVVGPVCLGSVTSEVIHAAHVPVTIVK